MRFASWRNTALPASDGRMETSYENREHGAVAGPGEPDFRPRR
jgi:hypothetical protein